MHGTHADPAEFKNEYVGHTAKQINKGVAYSLGGGEDHYTLEATYYGPAYQVTRMKGVATGLLINCHVPIDEERVDLRFAVALSSKLDREMSDKFAAQYIDNLREGFLQDVRIWENKIYLDKPMLCDGDGPITKLRRWYKQFYTPSAEVDPQAVY